MSRVFVVGLALALVAASASDVRPQDAFGGPGDRFFIARAVDDEGRASVETCADHFGPPSLVSDAVRGATLLGFEPDIGSGEIPPDANYTPVGGLTVCYFPPVEFTRRAVAVFELVRGEDRLRVEAEGDCQSLPTAIEPSVRLQTCSLTVLGPLPEGVRSGLLTSNGLVRRDQPTSSVNDHVWTLFVVRD